MYGHMTDSELTALRDKLQASYTKLLTGPTVAAGTGRRVEYQQQAVNVKRELMAVIGELERRAGRTYGGPIYPVSLARCGR